MTRTFAVAILSVLILVLVGACDDGGGGGADDSGPDGDADTDADAGPDGGDPDLGPLQAMTEHGIVEGFEGAEGVRIWKGIPFASPPLGDLRWRAPEDPAGWDGVLETIASADMCPQIETDLYGNTSVVGAEDCLYLDVYSPAGADGDLPVYVWIHGGSNKAGSAGLFEGEHLAHRAGVVVVMIQYRLGPFGFMTHPALRSGDRDGPLDASGNYGLLDQMKALEWVRDNVSAFGGDPGAVTVAGESAGATDIIDMLASPLAEGLFHRAISQSGGMYAIAPAASDSAASGWIDELLVAEGLAGDLTEAASVRESMSETGLAEFMEGVDAETWIDSEPVSGVYAGAVIDGHVLPADPICAIRAGDYNEVPIILGANDDEMKFFMPLYGPVLNAVFAGVPDYSQLWFAVYGAAAVDSILSTEEQATYDAASDVLSRLWRAEHADSIARDLREHQDHVYVYRFMWDGDDGSAYQFVLGAAHGVEIPLFHGQDDDIYEVAVTMDNLDGWRDLSSAMMGYVAEFAATGDPGTGQGAWPQWEPWGNGPGEARLATFDADADAAVLGSDTVELTVEAMESELSGMTDETARQMAEQIAEWHNFDSAQPVCD